ncbi:hypothetical protein [Victivallis vadensis]|uniref:hypothetical protein n=1 Tax=Victivallis vadensis TaxID=172901 RepID=UPI003D060BD8
MTLLPQLSDFSFMGKKWGKKRFTGKKWGTFVCQSANLQTGNHTDSLIAWDSKIYRFFSSFSSQTGKKRGRKYGIDNHSSPALLFRVSE